MSDVCFIDNEWKLCINKFCLYGNLLIGGNVLSYYSNNDTRDVLTKIDGSKRTSSKLFYYFVQGPNHVTLFHLDGVLIVAH